MKLFLCCLSSIYFLNTFENYIKIQRQSKCSKRKHFPQAKTKLTGSP